jgi:hypothetical protein
MRDSDYDPLQYIVAAGSVQPVITRAGNENIPQFWQRYGRAAYSRDEPIVSDSLRKQGQLVCDALNAGEIDESEARRRLKTIYF